jgi:hypothetical protein
MFEVYHNCSCLLHVCVYCHFRMNLCLRRISISIKFSLYIYQSLNIVEIFGSMHGPGMDGYVTIWYQSSILAEL